MMAALPTLLEAWNREIRIVPCTTKTRVKERLWNTQIVQGYKKNDIPLGW
jgi:hypothetical protein